MNKLKPYLLWIVAGVLLLVLVVMMLFASPTVPLDGVSKDAYEVKLILDADAKKLKELAKRAHNGDPPGIYDPQSEDDIRKLTHDFLLTNRWLDAINPSVKKYSDQRGQIRDDLLARSKVINEPVAPTSDRLQWYTPYQKQTGELVAKLRNAGCLLMPTDGQRQAVRIPAGVPLGAEPAVATAGTDVELDPEKSAKIRSLVGLFTSEGDLPEPDQHPLLTARFRIVERISAAVLASNAEVLANPVIGDNAPARTPAAFAAWEWKIDNEQLDPPVGDYAKPWRCTVTLQGSESALVAALANIESLDRPILIVLGSTLSRIDRAPAGARKLRSSKGVGTSAPARLEVQVLVLDFSDMPEVNSSAAPAAKPGMPGTNAPTMPRSMPPGMPPGVGGPPSPGRPPTPPADGE